MNIQKLSWAGILVQSEDTVILIDPLGKTPRGQEKPLNARLGDALVPLFRFEQMKRPSAILITHIHTDHFDHESIIESFGLETLILVPHDSVEKVRSMGFKRVMGARVEESQTIGSLSIVASYSIDGFGSPQVSWIVSGAEGKIIHCGDTLFHGYWWKINREHGPFDVACLPINGAIVEVNGLPQQSLLPACMTPEEAVEAAKLLGVKKLVPIHFGTFDHPPYYIQTPDCLNRLQRYANERNVSLAILDTGQTLHLQ